MLYENSTDIDAWAAYTVDQYFVRHEVPHTAGGVVVTVPVKPPVPVPVELLSPGGANAETSSSSAAAAAAAGRTAAARCCASAARPSRKVQCHEERQKAHTMEVDHPSQSKPLKQKFGKAKIRAVAVVAAVADVAEDDRAPRTPPPNCYVLLALVQRG